jgi:predicted transcriptional regulator
MLPRYAVIEVPSTEGGPTTLYVVPAAEYEVMKSLLGNEDGMSVAEIRNKIEQSGKRMSNASIYTLLARLMGKGLVQREETETRFRGTMMKRMLFKLAVVVISDREAS